MTEKKREGFAPPALGGSSLLVVFAVGSTPVVKTTWNRLPEKLRLLLTPVLVLGTLVLSTAHLVEASYNPFLYFRF